VGVPVTYSYDPHPGTLREAGQRGTSTQPEHTDAKDPFRKTTPRNRQRDRPRVRPNGVRHVRFSGLNTSKRISRTPSQQ
jgi:hypothetical protein